MKILGLSSDQYGEKGYIVEILHDEVRAVANKGGYHDKFPDLNVGENYPIAEGYNFRRDIREATKAMQEAHQKFQAASATMARFTSLLQARAEEAP